MGCACNRGTSPYTGGSQDTVYVLRNASGTFEFSSLEDAEKKRAETGGTGVITRRN